MGCRSDYLDPTYQEINSKVTAQHLVYVANKLNQPVPEYVTKAAYETYGNPEMLDEMVVQLCDILTNLDDTTRDSIVYNAKDKQSRELADWWEEHQKADAIRIAKENAEKNGKVLAEKAMSKLSAAELAAIKKYS